jgi:hypothetical protein
MSSWKFLYETARSRPDRERIQGRVVKKNMLTKTRLAIVYQNRILSSRIEPLSVSPLTP